MDTPEGKYIFYKDMREGIKSRSMLPTDTLRYIEALEAVARAGYEVWKNTPHANKPTELTRAHLEDLYDALAAVNFMDEEM